MRLTSVLVAGLALVAMSADGAVTVYPEYPREIERDYAYAVRVVQGGEKKRLEVYNHCEKSALTTRTHGGDVNRRFCEFAFDGGGVRVDVAVCEDVESYAVFPSRLGLRSAFKDGVISVWLDRPAMFGIRLNDYDKSILSVFAEAPEDPAKVPQRGAPGVMFVEGWVDAKSEDGVTVVEPPVKEVYIAPGAVLNSRLVVKTKGAYVHGRGMMLDPMSDVFRYDQNKNTKRGFLNVSAPDVTVEDIKLVDARTFNYCSWTRSLACRNIKALSSMMCTDGITCGGSGISVDGAWLYVGDNALVISGIREKGRFRDVAIGTSCNAIFPQNTNADVVMENVDVFRADEGFIKNVYNGVLRRNTKWNEMNSGEAKKEPGPQDLVPQGQQFLFRNISAVDCVLFSRFFTGGNMGTLPKTFAFDNVAVPWPTGVDHWKHIGRKDGRIVSILHDSAKWLDSSNYVISATNFWMGGKRLDAIPADKVMNSNRVSISVVNNLHKSALPASPDRHEVNWTCPYKRYIGHSLQRDVRKVSPKKGEQRIEQPEDGANLLADRVGTRSAWQRCPSWLVKFDATTMDGGSRVYRLTQCERSAGILNIVTDQFLRYGNGKYRLSVKARAKSDSSVALEAHLLTNEARKIAKMSVPNDGQWHDLAAELETSFDMAVTDLVGVFLRSSAPADEICFKDISLVKTMSQ